MNRSCDVLHAFRGAARITVVGLLVGALCACVTAPPPHPHPPPPAAAVPPVNTNVYAYPQQGQSPEQQDRDRYECYVWANKQTGFDPSAPSVPPHARVQVVGGPPPGSGAFAGAATGALIGAAASNPWHAGPGALIGAVVGGAIGAGMEASARNQQAQVVDAANAHAQDAAVDRKAADYRRALGACLEGRGYTVR
jgi:hypothetical protein